MFTIIRLNGFHLLSSSEIDLLCNFILNDVLEVVAAA